MKKADILILSVIYHSYPETIRFIQSFEPENTQGILLVLADNSEQPPPADFLDFIGTLPYVYYFSSGKNLGYFGGAREALDHYLRDQPEIPRWVLVTNVDIVFTPGFLSRLKNRECPEKLGMVAPSILSKQWKIDYNPGLLQPYSASRFRFFRLLYSHYLIHNLYLLPAYLKKWLTGHCKTKAKRVEGRVPPLTSIYAPHGSCLIFSHRWFEKGGNLRLPHFLFGEEIFVAETTKRLGLEVIYDPSLEILDYEHASVGFFVNRTTNRYYREMCGSIRSMYYQ